MIVKRYPFIFYFLYGIMMFIEAIFRFAGWGCFGIAGRVVAGIVGILLSVTIMRFSVQPVFASYKYLQTMEYANNIIEEHILPPFIIAFGIIGGVEIKCIMEEGINDWVYIVDIIHFAVICLVFFGGFCFMLFVVGKQIIAFILHCRKYGVKSVAEECRCYIAGEDFSRDVVRKGPRLDLDDEQTGVDIGEETSPTSPAEGTITQTSV